MQTQLLLLDTYVTHARWEIINATHVYTIGIVLLIYVNNVWIADLPHSPQQRSSSSSEFSCGQWLKYTFGAQELS